MESPRANVMERACKPLLWLIVISYHMISVQVPPLIFVHVVSLFLPLLLSHRHRSPRLSIISPPCVPEVMEGMEILEKINGQFCDDNGRPYRDIRILHTYVLDDPFDDPPQVCMMRIMMQSMYDTMRDGMKCVIKR